MVVSDSLLSLGRLLAGEFDNHQQALADPTWYVHLRQWQRPIKIFGEGCLGFFVEQISVVSGGPPYRQRVLCLQEDNHNLWVQYFALRQPETFCGAAQAPDHLQQLQQQDLIELPTCRLRVSPLTSPPGFRAELPPDSLCCFTVQGQERYVHLGFEVTHQTLASDGEQTLLLTYDKGIDPTTKQALWGAIMGPFRLIKQQDFSQEL